jgi:UDP-2-acetamido-2-deoxy-ribo-hexuluronate aminotransferase
MQKISMVDLQSQYLRIKPEVDEAIQGVLKSTAFIQGPPVKEFEQAFSSYYNGAEVISCANGTDALQIAMMALDLHPGDEVILPVFTYVATAEVIALLGLKPVFVDVEEKTFTVDVEQVRHAVTAKTKAIVPVHLFGQCADLEPLQALAGRHGLSIIEDFAQAINASYRYADGREIKAGAAGVIGCTSFFPSKNLGCYGDGGAMITLDKSLAETLRVTANHGQRIKYHHDRVGVNSRLDTLQAAILKVKLKHLAEYEQARRAVAEYYDRALTGIPFFRIPYRAPYSSHVFHQYTLTLTGTARDSFKKYLEVNGIPSMIYYPLPLHFQKAFAVPGVGAGAFPISEKLAASVISLPIHTEMSEEQLSYICETIRKYPG